MRCHRLPTLLRGSSPICVSLTAIRYPPTAKTL